MSCILYAESDFEKYFKKQLFHQYMQNTSIEKYSKGIIVNEHGHGFGVFDENFRFVDSSRQIRKNRGQFIPEFNHNDIPYLDEDAIFIGNVCTQFGHFLLEHMNRAYAVLDKKYKNMKLVIINNGGIDNIPGYIYTLLELLGVKRENIMILNQTTRFRNVYVPTQGFNIPVYSSEAFGKIYDAIAKNVPDTEKYEKIYVSRARLKQNRTFGEVVVQKIFEKNEYKIIYPETLPLSQQISLVKNCKYLAGCAGTALHLALFMKPGGTVIQIKRNRLPKCNADIQNLINTTKKLNGVFISGSIEKVRSNHSSSVPQIIGVNKYMREFFNAYNFKYSEQDTVQDDEDFNNYKKALAEYNQRHGSVLLNNLKHSFIMLSACLIPGRERRGMYRRWLSDKLKYAG